MDAPLPTALWRSFLGHAPDWYKLSILICLLANPLLLALLGPTITAWVIVIEFIATLAMALKCYPLQPGGLIAAQAVLLGLTNASSVYDAVVTGLPMILLLVFMVAGIYFLKDLLLFLFTKILLGVRAQTVLAMTFLLASAVLSAFLDALTVLAVLITVTAGFYEVYHKIASGRHHDSAHDAGSDQHIGELHHQDLVEFRDFLRGLLMHAAIGTALGGAATQVGEPQNLLIAKQAGWSFGEFFVHVAPVFLPTLLAGLVTCVLIDRLRWFGYGTALPANVRAVLQQHAADSSATRSTRHRVNLWVQGLAAIVLGLALGFHLAEVGLIGLLLIVLTTSFMGITDEPRIGKAFEVALPFTCLLVVFFVIVAQIRDQHLFEPILQQALSLEGRTQTAMFYASAGVLSAIGNGVFVATVYISEVKAALLEGVIQRQQFENLAVAINMGTNIPSVATPNGQAAFLFLLTSALAPLIRLSYGRMIWMALPYAFVLTCTGVLAVMYFL